MCRAYIYIYVCVCVGGIMDKQYTILLVDLRIRCHPLSKILDPPLIYLREHLPRDTAWTFTFENISPPPQIITSYIEKTTPTLGTLINASLNTSCPLPRRRPIWVLSYGEMSCCLGLCRLIIPWPIISRQLMLININLIMS